MPTFGFSAYLKLISMSAQPRATAIRGRVSGGGGGYDYHRSMKRAAHRFLVEREPIEDVLVSLEAIKRAPERQSARAALERLAVWRAGNSGDLLSYAPVTYAHPSGLFNVTFTPDFGLNLGGEKVALHIWNTATPALTARTVYAALSLFPSLYGGANVPGDLALLSLREPHLYRLSEAGRYAGLGASVAESVAEGFRQARSVLDLPPVGDQPPQGPR